MTTDREEAEVVPIRPVTKAVEMGRRDFLVSLRDRLWHAMHEDKRTQPRDLPPLSRQLRDINEELEAIDARAEQEAIDAATPDEAFDPEEI